MLISIESSKPITRIPHAKEYRAWMARLSAAERDAIFAELESRVSGGEVHTSSWIPGNDWQGTVFQPIYEKACNHNVEASGLCFGLMVWEMFMRHEANWSFGRYEKHGLPIKGLTYFRIGPSRSV